MINIFRWELVEPHFKMGDCKRYKNSYQILYKKKENIKLITRKKIKNKIINKVTAAIIYTKNFAFK